MHTHCMCVGFRNKPYPESLYDPESVMGAGTPASVPGATAAARPRQVQGGDKISCASTASLLLTAPKGLGLKPDPKFCN